MNKRLTSQEVSDQAANWAARIDAVSDLPPAERAAMEAWLSADKRHLGAFLKARALSLHSERAKALGTNFNPGQFGAKDEPIPIRRRLILTGSIAASVAAIGATVGLAPHLRSLLSNQIYATGLGETQVISLEDGSVITLNTNSKVGVRYSRERRDIALYRGEALFDVAKNHLRPFVVTANGTEVRAVGTSFTVKALPDLPVQILVREGVVEVKRPETPAALPMRVAANTRAVAPPDAPIAAKPVAAAEVNRELSWRIGRVSFEGETLGEAASTFARYSDTHIVIDDPEITRLTVSGIFVSNDPVGFAKAIATAYDLRAVPEQGDVRLMR